jgi:hypothetical protein
LPRAIAVREISVAVSPSALFNSVQFILSYFAGLIDATVDEQPAATSNIAGKMNGAAAAGLNFMLSPCIAVPRVGHIPVEPG